MLTPCQYLLALIILRNGNPKSFKEICQYIHPKQTAGHRLDTLHSSQISVKMNEKK